jgi:hypothetical protein
MLYTITKIDVFNKPKVNTFSKPPASLAFTLNNRYSNIIFQGIMPDNGAAGISTTRKPQVIAFQKLDPIVSINISIIGNHKIRFRKGEVIFIGIIQVNTPLANITFYIFPTNTPFLYYLQNIDRMKVKLDNI